MDIPYNNNSLAYMITEGLSSEPYKAPGYSKYPTYYVIGKANHGFAKNCLCVYLLKAADADKWLVEVRPETPGGEPVPSTPMLSRESALVLAGLLAEAWRLLGSIEALGSHPEGVFTVMADNGYFKPTTYIQVEF